MSRLVARILLSIFMFPLGAFVYGFTGLITSSAVTCPTCGYNLTGLGQSRCPECGSRFTLDELIAAQPNNKVEIE